MNEPANTMQEIIDANGGAISSESVKRNAVFHLEAAARATERNGGTSVTLPPTTALPVTDVKGDE